MKTTCVVYYKRSQWVCADCYTAEKLEGDWEREGGGVPDFTDTGSSYR